MNGASLAVDGLQVTYRTHGRVVHAVRDATFAVGAGGSLAIVGESGSGKSTIARAIAGVVPATNGSILLDGVDIARDTTRAVQMVFQDPSSALNPRRTVGASIAEILRVRGAGNRAQARASAVGLLEQVGLDAGTFDRRPARLSGGQRQRASIARALAAQPRVLIADEATSALDVTTQASVLALFDRLRRTQGCTLVVITHNLAVAREVCDDVVVMRDGRLVEYGTCAEVLTNPSQEYTAELLSAVLPMPSRVG